MVSVCVCVCVMVDLIMSSQFVPLCYVFPWCCHDIIPVAKLLPRALPAQDHLTQLTPAGMATVVDHGNVNSCILDLGWLHIAGEGLVKDGRATLCLLLGPHPPQHLVPS